MTVHSLLKPYSNPIAGSVFNRIVENQVLWSNWFYYVPRERGEKRVRMELPDLNV